MNRRDRITQIVEMRMVSVTPGMAKVLGKGEVAKHCAECGLDCPKYPGRYPKLCPACGYDWEVPGEIPVETEERRHRIEGLLELAEKYAEPQRYEVLENFSKESADAILKNVGSQMMIALGELGEVLSASKVSQISKKLSKFLANARKAVADGKDVEKHMNALARGLSAEGMDSLWPSKLGESAASRASYEQFDKLLPRWAKDLTIVLKDTGGLKKMGDAWYRIFRASGYGEPTEADYELLRELLREALPELKRDDPTDIYEPMSKLLAALK